MPLLKDEARSFPVSSFISLCKDEKSSRDNIRIASNHISILDDEGEIIEEIVPLARILPNNLQNQQVNERSLLNSLDWVLKGMNLTVLYIGASFSGKEKLFDGDKRELPLAYHFIDKLFGSLRQKYRKFQLRMKAGVGIKEKLYDCNSQNKYATLKVRQNAWEGVQLVNMNAVPIENGEDFKREIQRVIKQKNRLILQFKDLYTSFLEITIVREGEQEYQGKIISTVTFLEIPGVQILSQPQGNIKNKEGSLSTRSILNLTSILHDISTNPEAVPEYDSLLGQILKDKIGGNSHLIAYHTLRSEDIEGSRGTIKFLSLTDNLQQYPLVNSANGFGYLRKLRAEAMIKRSKGVDKDIQQQKNFLQNQITRVKTQQDYNRLLEKYAELKNKFSQALKSKSQAQLQLIKCEEQKLQIGKALVQVQIQNTKLLEKLQNKDYQNGKKVLQTENKLAQRQSSYQQCLDKIQQLNLALNEALQTRRDLQVEFVALKRNFIMQQKQNGRLKQDNQNLSLDVVNLSNQNQQLKQDFLASNKSQDKSGLVMQLQNQKYDELKRDAKRQQQTITYLKSQIERYKKDLIEREVSFQQQAKKSGLSGYGKDYDRIELQNENLQLQNKVKLLQRRVEQTDEKVAFYEQQNDNLEEQNKKMRAKDINDTNQYRKKLEQLSKGTNYQAIVRELRENFARKDTENLNKIDQLKRSQAGYKKQIANLKSYMRQMLGLLDQWAPKGVQIPALRKLKNLDLSSESGGDQLSQLRIKNVRLEEQIRKLKVSGGMVRSSGAKSSLKPQQTDFRQSRVQQQFNYLKNGSAANSQVGRLKEQNVKIAEQNRRLMILLKDGNKMDLNVIRRENDNYRKQNQMLRKEIESMRNQSSVSPSTSDQKLIYYQKHLKVLEKQRSQLLSRCVVAQQQLKSLMAKVGRVKN